jgi:hypothetical protein
MARHSSILIFGLLLASGHISAGQAACSKDALEVLKFAVANAPSNFSAIRGDALPKEEDDLSDNVMYSLAPAMAQFCPNQFALQDTPSFTTHPQYWELSWNLAFSSSGDPRTVEQVEKWIFEHFDPVLKLKGYRFTSKVILDETGWELTWDGPSDTEVVVLIEPDGHEGPDQYQVRVDHDVN